MYPAHPAMRNLIYRALAYVLTGLLYVAAIGGYILSIEPVARSLPPKLAPVVMPIGLFTLIFGFFYLWNRVPAIVAKLSGADMAAPIGRARLRPDIGWPEAEIRDGGVYVARYPFSHASVFPGDVFIPAARITSVFSSYDAAYVLDGNEVIFLPRALKEPFLEFAAANGIRDPKLPEVWALLTNEYLDTEYTAEDKTRDLRRLAELGFSEDEVRRLKAPIKTRMFIATFYTMEWGGYTTQDVLRILALSDGRRMGAFPMIWWPVLDAAFYWQIMEVALRPYGRGDRGGALPTPEAPMSD